MTTDLQRLQQIEREYDEYLRSECESVGADTKVEHLENPRLVLAIRYQLALKTETGRTLGVLCESLQNIKNAKDNITQGNFSGAALDLEVAASKLRGLPTHSLFAGQCLPAASKE